MGIPDLPHILAITRRRGRTRGLNVRERKDTKLEAAPLKYLVRTYSSRNSLKLKDRYLKPESSPARVKLTIR